jgi:hypothetical protein
VNARKLVLIGVTVAGLIGCGSVYAPQDNIRQDSLQGLPLIGISSQQTDESLTETGLSHVRNQLKDPGSAQFRNVRVVPYKNGRVVCGEVNGKNSYGGYVGFTPFVAGELGSTLYYSSEYRDIEMAANAGLISACGLGR